jgi:hypothetical protein
MTASSFPGGTSLSHLDVYESAERAAISRT